MTVTMPTLLILHMTNQCTKFDNSSFSHSLAMIGASKI